LTERVLGAVFEVSDTLGAGFLEEVYQRALLPELRVEEVLVGTDRTVSRLLASLGPESVWARQFP
jgi:GxxExxY protein